MRPATMVSAIVIVTAMAAVSSQIGGSAKADIYNVRGEKIGTATLSQVPDGVKIGLEVSKLSPGMHGIHIHAVGKCDPPDFSTAGPHLNPQSKKHGLQNPEGAHAGDMKNLTVGADGTAHIEFADTLVSLAEDVPNSLFHPKGTAIVIHADPDDEMTDPSGKSGARIACGVISK
jgi:Cu-Zn family superoxide dismutase